MRMRFTPTASEIDRKRFVTALTILEEAVVALHRAGQLKRDFCAICISDPTTFPEAKEDRTWARFQQDGVFCWAWLGNEASFIQAERDYLANGERKTFTAWRLEMDNSDALFRSDLLVPEDSRWPGSVSYWVGWSDGLTKPVFIGISGQLPHQDSYLGASLGSLLASLWEIEEADDLKALYPTDGKDTVGGESFDYRPDFSGFESPVTPMSREETIEETLQRH